MRRLMVLGMIACLGAAAWSVAQEDLPQGGTASAPPTDARHHSYAIGLDIGSSFRGDQIELDVDSLLAGVQDGLKAAKPRYSPETCSVAMQRLTMQQVSHLKARNEAFLTANRDKEGVQSTPSGLQYKVLRSGPAGGAAPGPNDMVSVHYTGRLIDGTVFDSSEGRGPAQFVVTGVIPAWTEALQKMKVGDKWQLFIPSKLAYRDAGAGDVIPPHATLVFEVELLNVQKAPAGGRPRPSRPQ